MNVDKRILIYGVQKQLKNEQNTAIKCKLVSSCSWRSTCDILLRGTKGGINGADDKYVSFKYMRYFHKYLWGNWKFL